MSSCLEILDDRVLELVGDDARLTSLADGFTFIEGPVWVADPGYLLFSDVLASRRYRWDERDGVRVVAEPSHLANGMTLDREGRLVVCEAGGRAITRMSADGTAADREIVADSHQGRALNSPNDVVVSSDGAIWFTDPWYLHYLVPDAERELDFEPVFRIPPGGGPPEVVLEDGELPNGLCFSPDESLLYVNESTADRIRVLAMSGGTAAKPSLFTDVPRDKTVVGHVDGMKCDERGNVWVTGPGGVWIVDTEGRHIGTIRTPMRTSNLTWGGPDRRLLYLTCSTGLYRLETLVAGAR
jgi:gluconolactonase